MAASSGYNNSDVVIVAAGRTPIGNLNGCLSSLKAHELGAMVIRDVLARARFLRLTWLKWSWGQDRDRDLPARAAMNAGIPSSVPAYGVNMLCGSGLKAVALGYQAVVCDESAVIVAGGQESMSQAPHCCNMRTPLKMGDAKLMDTYAENVAKQWQVSRDDQDRFAVVSQNRVENSQKEDYFKEEIITVPVKTRKGTTDVTEDEFPRHGTNMEGLARLKPCFLQDGTGTVTAGNTSGINDGSAAVVLMSYAEATRRGVVPLARIVSWGQAGVDPAVMGTGPIPATRKALQKASWKVEDVDLFELNEAFAAQSCAVVKDLGLDPEKVNINGGALALGHPIGASGCRILVTLLYGLNEREQEEAWLLCASVVEWVLLCVWKGYDNNKRT
ncbi:Acetyl-CoA acetyltransferase, cytosolic [Desmophyllum pertusum]|uniref:Acetyl-CoA acetyltransferase, cytosolic n=1 Tax=Desmophyllum pertusum TaxID=174260 RepID=A0A9X0CDF2_9CNID|nr:Acetyl-CoA acetyltransferase, cytosolic [Desmophyllum pertusum]